MAAMSKRTSPRPHTPAAKARRLLKRHQALSRGRALARVARLLTQESAIPDEAFTLMTLFQFHCDELTESGVSYEMVRALERRYPLLFVD